MKSRKLHSGMGKVSGSLSAKILLVIAALLLGSQAWAAATISEIRNQAEIESNKRKTRFFITGKQKYYVYLQAKYSGTTSWVQLATSTHSGSTFELVANIQAGTHSYRLMRCDSGSGGAVNCDYSPTVGHTTTVPTNVSEVYEYDPLGRLTRVYDDNLVKTGYCYDAAGNRYLVTANEGGGDDCEATSSQLVPPTNLNVTTHYGAGYVVSWSPVAAATRYELKFGDMTYYTVNNPSQTSYSTPGNTLDDEPQWIKACNEVTCSAKAYF